MAWLRASFVHEAHRRFRPALRLEGHRNKWHPVVVWISTYRCENRAAALRVATLVLDLVERDGSGFYFASDAE